MIAALTLLLGINCAAFFALGLDKARARSGGWRVRESTLLWLAFLGGSVGAVFAQQLFRHKTRKQRFRTELQLIIMVQIAGLALSGVPAVQTAALRLVSAA